MNPLLTLKLSAFILALLLTGCGSDTTTETEDTPASEEQNDKNNPDTGSPDNGNPDDGNPDDGNPDDGNPDDGNPDDGNPDDGNPDDGNPDDGNPDDGNPDDGNPDDGTPETSNAQISQLNLINAPEFEVGITLSVAHACTECDVNATTIQWFADDATEPFATGEQYTLTNADLTRTLSVVATPFDSNGLAGATKSIAVKKNKFVELFATRTAFAGLTEDGRVYTWGEADCGGESYGLDLTDIHKVFSVDCTFLAVKRNGTIIAWGEDGSAQDSTPVVPNLTELVTYRGDTNPRFRVYAALSADGTVYPWGGNSTTRLPDGLTNIKTLKDSSSVMAALSNSGELTVSARAPSYLPSAELSAQFTNVKDVFLTNSAFAVLKNDGTVIGWDSSADGKTIDSVQDQLVGIESLHGNSYAIVALKTNKDFVTWGSYGSRDLSSISLSNVASFHAGMYSMAAVSTTGDAILWSTSSVILSQYDEWKTYTGVDSILGDHNLGVRFTDNRFEAFNTGISTEPELTQVSQYHSNQYANIAVSASGTELWGNKTAGALVGDADVSNLVKIIPNEQAFSAINSEGDIVSWGTYTSSVHEKDISFADMDKILLSNTAYALLTTDGQVKTWGDPHSGGYIPEDIRAEVTSGISDIASTNCSFLVRKADNTVKVWGGFANSIVGAPVPTSPCGLGTNELTINNVETVVGNGSAFAMLTSNKTVKLVGSYLHPDNVTYIESLTGIVKVLPLTVNSGFAFLTDEGKAIVIEYGESRYETTGVKDIFTTQIPKSVALLKLDGTVAMVSFSNWDPIESITGLTGVDKVIPSSSRYTFVYEDGSGVVWPDYNTKGILESTPVGVNLQTAKVVGAKDGWVAKLANDEIVTWGATFDAPASTPTELYGHPQGVIYQYEGDQIDDLAGSGLSAMKKHIDNVERVIHTPSIHPTLNSAYYILQKDGNIIALNHAVALPDYPSISVVPQ